MTKVLFTLENVDSGGVEKRRLLIIKSLLKRGYDFEIICTYKKDNELTKEIEGLGVKVHELKKTFVPWNLKLLLETVNLIKEYKPDIIHGGVFEGCAMAAVAGSMAGVPYRIIEETSNSTHRKKRADYLMKFYGFLSHIAVGISPAVTHYLTQKAKIPANKVKLINNGVEMPMEVSDSELSFMKKKFNLSNEDFVIGTVGRMINDREKRYSDLIMVTHLMKEKGMPVKLLMVGHGRELENYKKLVKDLKIVDNVIFIGYSYKVDLYYKMIDVFSLVSANEGFGLVLAEAMLNKLPTVGTNIGGIKSIIVEGETGFLVEVGNINQMVSSFEKLYQNKNLREKLGVAGYKRCIENYSEQVYIKQILNLYQRKL